MRPARCHGGKIRWKKKNQLMTIVARRKKRVTPRMQPHENKQRWIQGFLLHSKNGRIDQATLQQAFVTECFLLGLAQILCSW